MPENSEDQGVILVLLERFNEQRLPRALAMKEKVDHGEPLDDHEVEYLTGLMDDIRDLQPLLERNPQYEPLVVKGLSLYKEITDKAIALAVAPETKKHP